MVLIGTAGHVDHGKSTLVEALSGINPMHLPEEHRRELTIELGFANLRHPDGYTVGIVDVPGHERLVKTMISGASGYQIALWVVDAREGLMPQSVEHFDVLKLLGIPHIVPVITKAGTATEEEILRTTQSIEQVSAGPVQVVDSWSKVGIPQLLETIFVLCRSLGSNKSRVEAQPYLSIDRCFVLKGVGTVVTGTLVRGELREGDSVMISSRSDLYRIRSLHNHNKAVGSVSAGHRVGVQLHGLKVQDVQHGDVLVSPDYDYRSRNLNAELHLLTKAPLQWKPGLRAHFLAASFEMECRLWGLVRSETHTWVQIQLPRETCFYPGQRFVLRSASPLTTIGGGTVVDIAPDRLRRVTKPEQNRESYFEESKPTLYELSALAKKWMCNQRDFLTKDVRTASGLAWHSKLDALTTAGLEEWIGHANNQIAEFPFQSLAAALKIKQEWVGTYLKSFIADNFTDVLTLTSSTLRYDPRRGELSDSEYRVAQEFLRKLQAAQLQPFRLAEYCAESHVEKKTFDKAVSKLLKDGLLCSISKEFLLERGVWDGFRDLVQRSLVESFTVSEFGKSFGLSRKYSVPYLECLNRTGAMRRQADLHFVVRTKSNL